MIFLPLFIFLRRAPLFSLPTFFFFSFLNRKGFSGSQQFDALGQTKWHHFKGHTVAFSGNRKAYATSMLNLINHWLVVMDERKACENMELEDTINMFYRETSHCFIQFPGNIFWERFKNCNFGSQITRVHVVKVYQETECKIGDGERK